MGERTYTLEDVRKALRRYLAPQLREQVISDLKGPAKVREPDRAKASPESLERWRRYKAERGIR